MSIDVNVQNDLVIVTESSEDITVNVSNAAGPAGVGVPVGGTTGQVLKKFSNTNYDTYWALDGGGVPYSGATGDVNLGEYALSAGQLTLDTSPTGTATVGTTRWNNTIGSSETTLKGGSVILKNGVDLVARIVNKVTPNTTLTKAAYQAVRVSGAQGQRLAVSFAQANNDANSADTIGLVTETIPTNQEGFIITVGQLENINTTGSLQGETWVDGDVLYLSPTTPGAITKVKPTGAGHIVVIGYVEYAHANNGKIYVKVMNGWELDELHDVSIVSAANNEALIYESSTSLWKNKTIASALGYTPVPTTRTLTINGTSQDLSADRTFTVSAAPAGSNTQIQYNNGGALGASAGLVYNDSTGVVSINKSVTSDVGINITNGSAGTTTTASILMRNNANNIAYFGKASSSYSYKTITGGNGFVYTQGGDLSLLCDQSNGNIKFAAGAVSTAQMTLTAAGRLLLGTTSESTFIFDAVGDARVTGFIQSTQTVTAQGVASFPTSGSGVSLFYNINGGNIAATANFATSTVAKLQLNVGGGQVGINTGGNNSINTNNAFYVRGGAEFLMTNSNQSFDFVFATGTNTSLNLSRQFNSVGGGVGTSFRLNDSSSAAVEYASVFGGIQTNTAGSHSGYLYFNTTNAGTSTEKARITAAGRLLLGTTDEGTFRLDVNGTARVSAATSGSTGYTMTVVDTNTTLGTTLYMPYSSSNLLIQVGGSGSRMRGINGLVYLAFKYSNGNVVIGNDENSSMPDKLNISVNSSSQDGNGISLIDTGGSGNVGAGINYYGGTTTLMASIRTRIQSSYLNSVLAFSTNNASNVLTERFRITETGNLLVGSTTNVPSAILAADSTTKGFLPPRMTTTQKNAISTPTAGLQVYDTTLNQMSYYNGTTWINF
jgi:nitrogen fixation protein